MSKALRIELLPEEQRPTCEYGPTIVAISFGRGADGAVYITEHWDDFCEDWNDAVGVVIPPRVWQIGLKWLAEEGDE